MSQVDLLEIAKKEAGVGRIQGSKQTQQDFGTEPFRLCKLDAN